MCFTLTMWDVKTSNGVCNSLSAGFYLNYVGCKVFTHLLLHQTLLAFYLNYVGCKVFIKSCNCKRYLSFTLTMWDVKYRNGITLQQHKCVLP